MKKKILLLLPLLFLFCFNYYHDLIISNIYILSLCAVSFLYGIYYTFFIKNKINNCLLMVISVYYILYDIVLQNIICSSLLSFILSYFCYVFFVKFDDKNVGLKHYLISGNIFFISNFLISLLFNEFNLLELVVQCLSFSLITLLLVFIITNLNDKPKAIDYFVSE